VGGEKKKSSGGRVFCLVLTILLDSRKYKFLCLNC
jgi:hypothetical protein